MTLRPTSSRDLLGVFGIALALRGLHLWQIHETPFFGTPSSDAQVYRALAEQIVGGDWLLAERGPFYLGPLYIYFQAAIRLVAGPSPLALASVQVLLSAATATGVCWLGQSMFGRAVGLTAGLGAAVYGVLIFYSGVPLPATLVVAANLLALALTVRALAVPTAARWLAAGLAVGAAATARGNALLLASLVPFVAAARFGIAPVGRWLRPSLWLGLGVCLAVAPVTVRNAVVAGEWVPLTTNLGSNLFIGNHTGADGLFLTPPVWEGRILGASVGGQYQSFRQVARRELGDPRASDSRVSAFWVGRTLDDIRESPLRWLRLLGRKAYYWAAAYEVPNNRSYEFSKRFSSLLRSPLLGWGAVLPLAALGVWCTRRSWREHAILLAFAFASFAGVVAFFVTSRYRLPAVPVLLVYASLGGWQLVDWARAGQTRAWIAALAAILAIGAWIHAFAPTTRPVARWEHLGVAYEKQGRPEEALAAYDQALALAPGRGWALYEKGRLLVALGRPGEATPLLDAARRGARRDGDLELEKRVERALRRIPTSD